MSAPYLFVPPRTPRPRDRRHAERVAADFDIELKSPPRERLTTVDVSAAGLLVKADVLPPLRQPLMLTLHLPDGEMPAMAIVARHTLVDGEPAMGLRLLGMPPERELRWQRAIARFAERARSGEPAFEIDVVLDGE